MSWSDLLAGAASIRSRAAGAHPELATLGLAGIGWATVESERARRELVAALGGPGSGDAPAWQPIGRDPALGAGVWRYAAGPDEHPELVVLEPDTEGRIAASLARFGEGVAVIYLGDGPVRAGRLLRGGPAWGPHVVVL